MGKEFASQVVIVTGGSRGIGYATVKAFLQEGATVVLCASRPESGQKAVEQLRAELPEAEVSCIWPVLTDYASVQAAFSEVVQKYGRIDVLVNNAGCSDSTPFAKYTEENFRRVMELNVTGVYHCTRAVTEQMMAQHSGVILNTSSMVSKFGQPSGMAYPASKYAVNGMTVSLARELGPYGIRVNAVAPGITYTDMMKVVPESVIAPMVEKIPLRRIGQPEDIANAFVFLASRKASYITGVVLNVDGMASN